MRIALLLIALLATVALADKLRRPSNAAIAKALAKHERTKDMSPDACTTKRATKTSIVLRCKERRCSECQSTEVTAELRFRANGASSIHDVRVSPLRDRGECGYCMPVE